MRAYKEYYLEDAREHLGEMFDYAVNVYGMKADDLWKIFAASGIANCLSCGDPKYIAGMSGSELFANLIYDNQQKWIDLTDVTESDRSREYWAGWALAKYQWYSNRTYASIASSGIMLSDVIDMYILHEAPDEKFIEIMDERIRSDHEQNMLKRLRSYAGMTQRQLSDSSGVSLRMIQLYEQGQNDISKAQANVVMSLAQALGCDARKLLE